MSVAEATLGATLDVLTLDGMVELAVPPGSQPDATLVLRNKGVRRVNDRGGRGNQYVHLKVQVPRSLTPRQAELMALYLAEEQAATAASSGGGKSDANTSFAKLCARTLDRLKSYLNPEAKKEDAA